MKTRILTILLASCLAGCATWEEMPPYEKAWQAMNVIDAGQTIHIAREPSCYREVGFPTQTLIGEHPSQSEVYATMAAYALAYHWTTKWLDRKVERAFERQSDTRGIWYSLRVAFHGGMIISKGATIVNNQSIGLDPWGSGCP